MKSAPPCDVDGDGVLLSINHAPHRCSKLGISLRLLLLSMIGVLTLIGGVQAQSNVLLVNPETSLLRATEHALQPWEINVIALTATKIAPSESMPGARDRARVMCETHGARAAIWITSNQSGQALWVYDKDSDRVVVRKLTVRLPLGDADAAAVALSIKTLLMHTTAAPPTKRYGVKQTQQAITPPSPPVSSWLVGAEVLVRSGLGNRYADTRLGVGLLRRFGSFSMGAVVAAGPGYAVDAPEFRGHFSEASLGIEGRVHTSWRRLTWVGLGQLALHRATLDGTLTGGPTVSDTRYNPSIALGGAVQVPLRAAQLGLGVRSRYYTRSQRYLVRTTPVLDLPTVDLELGIFLSIPL